MKYSLQFERGGQIHVETHKDSKGIIEAVEVTWSSFSWLSEKLAHINHERVLNEVLDGENFEAMQLRERMKTFFTRIKDAEPVAFERVSEILKKNDRFLFEIIKAV